jgi:hypothetical protein
MLGLLRAWIMIRQAEEQSLRTGDRQGPKSPQMSKQAAPAINNHTHYIQISPYRLLIIRRSLLDTVDKYKEEGKIKLTLHMPS